MGYDKHDIRNTKQRASEVESSIHVWNETNSG
jgi:hypothetical protein